MSIDLNKYNLITESENKELFEIQTAILKDSTFSDTEKIIKLSLLLMYSPIADYETSVCLLNDYSDSTEDIRILMLGAELDAYWPSIRPNRFIEKLKRVYPKCSEKERSIIAYLEAIDIDNQSDQKDKSEKAKKLLKRSIALCGDYVNNYYRLALLSDKETAKGLMKTALDNIVEVSRKEEIEKTPMLDFLSYDNYRDEQITGTRMNTDQYQLLKDYYSGL